MGDHIRVFFVQDMGGEVYETESLWCIADGDNYIVDNIPFVAKRISLGDTIKAEYDADDKVFYFDDFVAVSGNTTVRLYFHDDQNIESVREELSKLECESERFLQRKMVAVNVPKAVDYKTVKSFLDRGEQQQKWTYEESCLAHEY